LVGAGIRTEKFNVLSRDLKGKIENIRFSQGTMDVRTGQFQLEKVNGRLKGSAGDATFHIKKADGGVEWNSKSGGLQIDQMGGAFMVKTVSGKISLEVQRQDPEDERWIETESGNILLTLPFSFAGAVDLWTMQGKLSLQFPWDREEKELPVNAGYGPETPNRILGRVGTGGTLLRLFSISGDIRVLKGK
jgi:DUF4097 and DUF4098 domain-containing protein YvlB